VLAASTVPPNRRIAVEAIRPVVLYSLRRLEVPGLLAHLLVERLLRHACEGVRKVVLLNSKLDSQATYSESKDVHRVEFRSSLVHDLGLDILTLRHGGTDMVERRLCGEELWTVEIFRLFWS